MIQTTLNLVPQNEWDCMLPRSLPSLLLLPSFSEELHRPGKWVPFIITMPISVVPIYSFGNIMHIMALSPPSARASSRLPQRWCRYGVLLHVIAGWRRFAHPHFKAPFTGPGLISQTACISAALLCASIRPFSGLISIVPPGWTSYHSLVAVERPSFPLGPSYGRAITSRAHGG